MTHVHEFPARPVNWSDFETERYDNNNGIVLRYNPHRDHRGEVVVFLDGAHLGFKPSDQGPEVLDRATPIFSAIINAHNRAFAAGWKGGVRDIRQQVGAALGYVPAPAGD
jgi:hypothetical protein